MASSRTAGFLKHSTFIAGDWNSIGTLTDIPHQPPLAPTLILASETVYRADTFRSQKRILQLFIGKHGCHPHGSALFAGRSFYFGVGGGITAFKSFLETLQPSLTVSEFPKVSQLVN